MMVDVNVHHLDTLMIKLLKILFVKNVILNAWHVKGLDHTIA